MSTPSHRSPSARSTRKSVKLVLPFTRLPLSQNDHRRAHWAQVAEAKREVEEAVIVAAKQAGLKKFSGPIAARLVWYAPDRRKRDCDSMAHMMKACLDALVKLRVIPDDNAEIVREANLGPVIVARDNPRFELQIKLVD